MELSKSLPGARAAAATSGAMIAQQVASKAARDALFLSSFQATSLPRMMAASAVVSLLAILWLSRLMARYSPRRVMPVLFAVSACGLVIEWGIGFVSPPVAAIAVYLQTAMLGPAVITSFWSLINERFDPHTAKPAVAKIAAGGTVGGVLGGLAAWRASSLVDVPTLLLFLAAVNAACFVGVLMIRAPKQPTAEAAKDAAPLSVVEAEKTSAVHALRTVPFLRNLGLLVALGAAISSLLDYVFSAQAVTVFAKGAPLLSFFSLFWLAVAVVSFLLQIALGRIAMEKLGLAVNIAVLPAIIVMGGAAGLAVPGLMSSALLRGAEAVQRNTLFRSAYELLYTPLPENQKRSTKALIDVGFDRLGTVVGAGIAMLALRLFAPTASSVLLGAVVFLAIATLPVVRQLHVGYVSALEEGLREGAKKLDLPPLDGARLSTLLEQHEGVQRDKLIQLVEALKPPVSTDSAGLPVATPQDTGPAAGALRRPESLLSLSSALLSKDIERSRRVLREWSAANNPAAGFVILLLAHKELHADAFSTLRGAAPQVVGQLVDALLDPSMDFAVRRRIPRVLSRCSSQRAADGLLLGIGDERFEVRYGCGRALMRMTELHPDIVIPREAVVAAILREVAKRTANAALATFEDDDPGEVEETGTLVDALLARDRVDRSLEHVFTILALHLDREPLRMAFRALHQEDDRHRGTALEYLQTILPADIRDAVWPFLGAVAPLPIARSANEVLEDLIRATAPQANAAAPAAAVRAAAAASPTK